MRRCARGELARLLVALLLATLAACDDTLPSAAPALTETPATAAPPATPTAPPPPPGEPATAPPLELLKFSFTSRVDGRDPVDRLQHVAPGARVHTHLTVRNRGRERRDVTIVFELGDVVRQTLKLGVDPSWSYRTWGYITLRPEDRGELRVRVLDEEGAELTDRRLAIRR